MIDLLYYTIELKPIGSGFESESKNDRDPGNVHGSDCGNHFPKI